MRNTFMLFFLSWSAIAAVPKSLPQKPNAVFPEGERLIYSRLVQSYRKSDLSDVIKQRRLLEQNYPSSIHMDSAYYLNGALEYQNDHLGEALRAFDQVVNKYSQSSKRPAALFAMGMTYRKLNLTKQSEAVFRRVMDLYPGSPDSQRAWLELRLLTNDRVPPKKTQ